MYFQFVSPRLFLVCLSVVMSSDWRKYNEYLRSQGFALHEKKTRGSNHNIWIYRGKKYYNNSKHDTVTEDWYQSADAFKAETDEDGGEQKSAETEIDDMSHEPKRLRKESAKERRSKKFQVFKNELH
jgi:hypothetical protein